MNIFCNNDVNKCNAWMVLNFMAQFSPMALTFQVSEKPVQGKNSKWFYPANSSIIPCNVPPDNNSLACSCQDCKMACGRDTEYPDFSSTHCEIGNVDCLVFISFLAFASLGLATILMGVLHYVFIGTNAVDYDPAEDDIEKCPSITNVDISLCESWGAWVDSKVEDVFHTWGMICCKHPLLVFLFGLSVSLVCSSGLYFVQMTTDPVKLWSSPGSRARQEKDFFDESFGPFFRTEQLIVVPTNQSQFKHVNFFDESKLWGPVFRKNFLKEVKEHFLNERREIC